MLLVCRESCSDLTRTSASRPIQNIQSELNDELESNLALPVSREEETSCQAIETASRNQIFSEQIAIRIELPSTTEGVALLLMCLICLLHLRECFSYASIYRSSHGPFYCFYYLFSFLAYSEHIDVKDLNIS